MKPNLTEILIRPAPPAERNRRDGMMTSRTTNDGVVKFSCQVQVTAADMANWSPEVIRRFFNGIAMVEEAAEVGRQQALSATPRHPSETPDQPEPREGT